MCWQVLTVIGAWQQVDFFFPFLISVKVRCPDHLLLLFCSTEVIRTRLREEGTKYKSFFQTLRTVPKEEGYRALYRGLTTHLVRQIPNTAIMMCTYELVVYLLSG